MPAYRSAAEHEVRDAVVAKLRQARPEGRIIHEINVGTYGHVRMDLICVSPAEIIAVEVKSSKDKLDRLPKQIAAMQGCAHHVIAALHEKHLVEQETNKFMAHVIRDGQHFLSRYPEAAGGAEVWVFPERRRVIREDQHDSLAKWAVPAARFETALPHAAIELLWREELASVCGELRVAAGRTSRMNDMVRALRWHCSGAELTRAICAALRRRECVEADPPISEAVAA